MPSHALFPTHLYTAALLRGTSSLNSQLLRECLQLAQDDTSGQRWSKVNYPGGYTSYGSVTHLQRLSPTFARLEKQLNKHVARFVRDLEMDLNGRKLTMTDCWVNIMPAQVTHSLHLHPNSTLSGTYYVQTPKGASALKFEDPRLDRFMTAPPRLAGCKPAHRWWYSLPAQAGNVVLFESWLRHEVSAHRSKQPRISISFNYHWC